VRGRCIIVSDLNVASADDDVRWVVVVRSGGDGATVVFPREPPRTDGNNDTSVSSCDGLTRACCDRFRRVMELRPRLVVGEHGARVVAIGRGFVSGEWHTRRKEDMMRTRRDGGAGLSSVSSQRERGTVLNGTGAPMIVRKMWVSCFECFVNCSLTDVMNLTK